MSTACRWVTIIHVYRRSHAVRLRDTNLCGLHKQHTNRFLLINTPGSNVNGARGRANPSARTGGALRRFPLYTKVSTSQVRKQSPICVCQKVIPPTRSSFYAMTVDVSNRFLRDHRMCSAVCKPVRILRACAT